jgi:nucleotide-binding universal stress UspA family protein
MGKRVLVPVDGSDVAEAILPFILETAGPLDMDIVLLQVNRPMPPVVVDSGQYIDVEDVRGRREEAEAYLAGLAAELKAKGVRAETRVRRGEPVDEILAAAKEERADLIAMTTHGRSGFRRVLFGSIAEGVLRHAAIPLVLMKQTEDRLARAQ